jgi:hypothetical protein
MTAQPKVYIVHARASVVPSAPAVTSTSATAVSSPSPNGIALDAGSQLIGYSTLALAIVTAFLATAAFWQATLSRRAIHATKLETERGFAFENVHQAQQLTPIIVAEATPRKAEQFRYLSLRNVGKGPAIHVRFSGTLNGVEFSAAQYSMAAVGPLELTGFRGHFPLGGERSTNGQKTPSLVPAGVSG